MFELLINGIKTLSLSYRGGFGMSFSFHPSSIKLLGMDYSSGYWRSEFADEAELATKGDHHKIGGQLIF